MLLLRTTRATYTPSGKLAAATDANNNATAFTYDGFDRLTSTSYPDTSTETAAYDTDSNVVSRTTRAGQPIAYAYDTLNRLITKTPPSPAPVVSYSYDLVGRLKSTSDTSAAIPSAVSPTGSPVAYTTSFTYDAMNRAAGTTWDPAPTAAAPGAASSVVFTHSYNKANQRAGQSVSDNSWINYPAAAASTTSYTPNALNQYTAVGGVSATYNTNGNLTSDGTYTLGYDPENRLTSATGAGNTAAYTFDAQGRRKTRTVNGTTTVSVTDAQNREVLEYNGSTGALLRWYAYGLGPNAVLGQMNVPANTRTTPIPDLLGSIVASIDAGAGTLTKFAYRPYGVSAAAPTPFGYTGQRIDQESGLYYYRARHYSPQWGRFTQTDPTGYQGGINLYAYVFNDPLNMTDSGGTAPDEYPRDYGFPMSGIFADALYGSATPSLGSLDTHAMVASVLASGAGLAATASQIIRSAFVAGAATAPSAAAPASTLIVVNSAGQASVVVQGIEMSIHATRMATMRNISLGEISTTVARGQSFTYAQGGQTLTGFYNWASNTFVGVGERITTVINPANPANYLRNLLTRTP